MRKGDPTGPFEVPPDFDAPLTEVQQVAAGDAEPKVRGGLFDHAAQPGARAPEAFAETREMFSPDSLFSPAGPEDATQMVVLDPKPQATSAQSKAQPAIDPAGIADTAAIDMSPAVQPKRPTNLPRPFAQQKAPPKAPVVAMPKASAPRQEPVAAHHVPVVAQPKTPARVFAQSTEFDPVMTQVDVPAPGRHATQNDPTPAPHPSVDGSVVTRLMRGVMSALPKPIRQAVGKSGLINLTELGLDDHALAAPKPQRPKADPQAWREMRMAPILDGVPNEALKEALDMGAATVLRLERDSLVPLEASLAVVLSGQVALALFPEEFLAEERAHAPTRPIGETPEKKEKKRRYTLGPLIRQADKNLATFEEGDIVETTTAAVDHPKLACFAVSPATVIVLSRSKVESWKSEFSFLVDRFRRGTEAARVRLDATEGARATVADFFIRHGLSISQTLRVRKIDACIECKACEVACEDRYGAKRLWIGGRILGQIDFVDACHTCTDQRCLDACDFDAITYDENRREVIIHEDRCVGSGACEKACPYDAIKMYSVDQMPKLHGRMEKAGALKFGDGTARKAKLKRVAQKCDHCMDYEDQACISACPTGALLEVQPSDIVSHMPEETRTAAKTGYDRSVLINVDLINRPNVFADGLKSAKLPEFGRARTLRTRITVPLWWAVGLLVVALSLTEILLRRFFPQFSIAYLVLTHVEGATADIARAKVDYHPGSDLAVYLGYAGTAVMITGMAYAPRRRFAFMRSWGSLKSWFDWHVMAGVVGPLLILLHSAAKFDNWVSLGVWAMIGTVLSGLLGRYLTTQLPERAARGSLEMAEVEKKLDQVRAQHPGIGVVFGWLEQQKVRLNRFDATLGEAPAPLTALFATQKSSKEGLRALDKDGNAPQMSMGVGLKTLRWVLHDDLVERRNLRELKHALKASVAGKGARKLRRQALGLANDLAVIHRRQILLPRLEPLYRRWKLIHVPFAIALTIIATIHIVLALRS